MCVQAVTAWEYQSSLKKSISDKLRADEERSENQEKIGTLQAALVEKDARLHDVEARLAALEQSVGQNRVGRWGKWFVNSSRSATSAAA